MTLNNENAMRSVAAWKSVLRNALREAQRARRTSAVAVFRETLAAIDNAEAVDPSATPPVQHGIIAGGVAGLGAGEVARRVLTAQEAAAVIEREIEERRTAVATYEAHGRSVEADVLRSQIDLLVALS
jgi:uncharacterized protein